ncbi:hypothetical protein Kisp01_14200 [Kineosporia sp. NBRC 101677]|nr:hypothetical protein Kisp01_14200 [Kineosporia sp. NBRC 101677]
MSANTRAARLAGVVRRSSAPRSPGFPGRPGGGAGPPVGRPRPVPWLGAVLAGSLVTLLASLGTTSIWSESPELAAPVVAFAGALVAAGVILSREPGQLNAGRALVVAGCVWPLSWISEISRGDYHLIAFLAGPLTLLLAAWAIYAYPGHSTVGRAERRVLLALTAWLLVGRLVVAISSDLATHRGAGTAWWPMVPGDPGLHRWLTYLSSAGELLLTVAFLVLWVRRSRRIRGLDRKLILPVAAAAALAGTASTAVSFAQRLGVRGELREDILVVQTLLLLTVPVAFVIATVRRRLTSVVIADLLPQLRVDRTPERLEAAFREVLADPGLEIHYWAAEIGAYVDRHGATSAEPGAESGENGLLLPITSTNGARLAMIRADQALWRYPDLVEAVGSAAGLAIENARLQVEARAQLELVRASHARIVAAQLAERQALEKDLDDGALRRVRELLEQIRAEPVGEIRAAQEYASEQLSLTVGELREIAAGLHPSILDQVGLAEAVRRIGAAQPVTVDVDLPEHGLPMPVQVAGYFVAAEAITNAVRHAEATRIAVRGADTGDSLRLTIEDDGCGGADLGAGTGLSGLSERVLAGGGTLHLDSPAGAGTTLTAEIPYR